MTVDGLARIIHEAHRAYCKSIGDYSHRPWDEAPDWQKESAVAGVRFHLENPGKTAEDIHNEWMKKKVDNGWVYGLSKDEEKKTHPCLVPYSALPLSQQKKDELFIAIVDTFRDCF